MEDRRAHERLDEMEFHLKQHTEDILRIERTVIENTKLTKSIESNTSEIVEIMRGSKFFISFIILLAKIGTAIGIIYVMWNEVIKHIRG